MHNNDDDNLAITIAWLFLQNGQAKNVFVTWKQYLCTSKLSFNLIMIIMFHEWHAKSGIKLKALYTSKIQEFNALMS